ncbi:WD40/YVTN/BNR-like repeat-containing protein [Sphaerisporangium aureirubrum]|uniref:WD40/YVTN/BNR-like repeat-containing protein n=1 Tax=Sphaerisporangium aureirubrum TaxID=1544736 RepID=A0ABW1NQ73_9ACTN
MTPKVLLAIGTRKGLWLAVRGAGQATWEVSGPHHHTTDVHAVAIDTRRGVPRVLAAVTSEHFGPSVVTSDDLGATWREPGRAPVAFPEDTGTALTRVWQIAPGPAGLPDVVYAGTEPSALFRSTDGGVTYELVRGLWDHPHRERWTPGGGGMAVHSVLPHPVDDKHVTVAMSTGGVYRTADGGSTWEAANSGVQAHFLPDPYPEFGQCVHKIAQHPDRPAQLFLQNHHGVYRTDDLGAHWQSIADGLPSDFGFPILVHPRRPGVVYTFPLTADHTRFPPDGRCRVYRSEDAGTTWTPLTKGLPTGFWSTVLRDALCADDATPTGLYFGSRSGELYTSPDDGDTWHPLLTHLPDILSLRAATIT